MGTQSTGANLTDANISVGGHVHGGQQPVTQSHIALFSTASATAGAAGYGSSATLLANATTDANGNFTITSSYTCPSTQQAYIVATGGNPGLTAGTDNSAIFLMAALGPCSGVNALTTVDIDEVTTVAAAYALSGFVPAGGAGMTEAAVTGTGVGSTMPGVTTSSTNTQGITDAFANANNIVSTTTGLAYTVPPSNSNGVVPQSIIHALADILQTCVNSSSPAQPACTSLFTAAQPPTGSSISTAPVNVFQAAVDIALYPGNNVSTLFGLINPSPAFPYTLTAAPNDWTVGITYTNSLLVSGTGLGINNLDQVFVSGAGYLLGFSPVGGPLSGGNLVSGSAITTADSLREIVFDSTGTATTSGNLFVTDGAATGVWKYTPNSNAVSLLNFDVAPVSEANNNTYGVAVDGAGDVWSSSYSKSTCASVTCPLVEFVRGTSYSPFSTFPLLSSGTINVNQPAGALGGSRGTAFDVKTGNVWITAIDDALAEVVTMTPSTSGAATSIAGPTTVTLGTEVGSPATNTAYGSIAVAIDSASRAWISVGGGAASTKSGSTTAAVTSAIYPFTSAGAAYTVGGTNGVVSGPQLNVPDTIVIDGNNTLFVANTASPGTVAEYSPAFNSNAGAFLSPNLGFSPGATYTSATSTLSGGTLYEPSYIAIDRSGALWALSSGSGSSSKPANLIQILGVAAPTDPVQADGNYGVKP